MKRKIKVLLALLMGLATMTYGGSIVNGATLGSYSKVEVPTSADRSPAKNSFIPKYIEGVTKPKIFGPNEAKSQWYYGNNGLTTSIYGNRFLIAKDYMTFKDTWKGKVGAIYENVGSYKGDVIDLKITMVDWYWKEQSTARLGFGADQINFNMGRGTTRLEWKFLKHGTTQEIKVTGYMTLVDMDAGQAIRFTSDTTSSISKIYVTEKASTRMSHNVKNGMLEVIAPGGNLNPADKEGQFTFLFDNTSTITFDWVSTYTNTDLNKVLTTKYPSSNADIKNILLTDTGSYVNQVTNGSWFGYISKKPLKTETIPPTKKVSDSDEVDVEKNTIHSNGDKFTYNIYHQIPDEYSESYYKSVVLSDSIDKRLIIDKANIKVLDDANKDVTSKFTANVDANNKVTFTVNSAELAKADFYNKTYEYIIPVSPDKTQVNTYIDATFTNKASMAIDGDAKASNAVTTVLNPPAVKNNTTKTIVNDGKDIDDLLSELKNGVNYKVTGQLGSNLKSISFSDTASAGIKVDTKTLKVSIDGTDVSTKGAITTSGNTVNWKIADEAVAKPYSGGTLTATYTAKLDSTEGSTIVDDLITLKNTASINDSESLTEPTVQIPNRIIKGYVWKDLVANNLYSADDTKLEGKTLHLFKYNSATSKYEEVVKNMLGETLNGKTDASGNYVFDYLDKGKYKVAFKASDLGSNLIVKQNVGSDATINSKFGLTATDGYYFTNEIDLTANTTEEKVVKPDQNLGLLDVGKLAITKEIFKGSTNVDGKQVSTNDILTINLKFKNSSTVASVIRGITISDVLNKNFQYVAGSLKLDGTALADSNISSNKLTVKIDELTDRKEHVITFNVKVLNDAFGKITNTANATSTTPDSSVPSNEVDVSVAPIGSIKKTVNTENVKLGEDLTYTIVVSNAKNAGVWKNVKLVDDLANKGFSYVANSLTVDGVKADDSAIVNNKLTYTLGDIKEGVSKTITFKVKVNELKTSYVNTAIAKSDNLEDKSSSVTVKNNNVEGSIDIVKGIFDVSDTNVDGKVLNTNATYTYKLTVSNKVANSYVSNIEVNDVLENNLDFVDNSITASDETVVATFDKTTKKIHATMPKLAGGKSFTITFQVKVNRAIKDSFKNVASYTGVDDVTSKNLSGTSNEVLNRVQPKPSITKAISSNKLLLGDVVTFTITVKNDANVGTWRDVYVKDSLSSNFSYVANSTKLDGTAVADADAWTGANMNVKVGNVLENDSRVITFQAKVVKYVIDYNNSTTATSSNNPDISADVSAKTNYVESNLKIVKGVFDATMKEDINGKEVATNSNITYKLTITNSVPNSKADNLVVSDVLPAGLEFVSGKDDAGKAVSYNATTRAITINKDTLDNEKGYVVYITAKVLNTTPDSIKNTGKVSYTDMVTNEDNTKVSNEVSNITKPAPYIEKTSTKTEVKVGEEIPYTITVGNKENAGVWRNVKVTDDLTKKGYSYIAGSLKVDGVSVADSAITNGILNYTLGDLKENVSKKITLTVKVTDVVENYINTAVAKGDNSEEVKDDVIVKNSNKPGQITIKKDILNNGQSISGKQLETNHQYTYRLTINNPVADSFLTTVKVSDVLQENLSYVANTLVLPEGVSGKFDGQTLTINSDSLNGEKTIVVEFKVLVKPDVADSIANKANGTAHDVVSNKDISTVSNEVLNTVKPEPSITKTISDDTLVLNQVVTFTITVKNGEDAGAWRDVVVEDELPTQFALVADSTKVDGKQVLNVWTGNKLKVELGKMLEKGTHVVTFDAKVIEYQPTYKNTAKATGSNSSEVSDVASAKTQYVESNLKIAKDVVKGDYKIGEEVNSVDGKQLNTNDTITYILSVENTVQDSIAKNIIVSDILPKGLKYISMETSDGNKNSNYNTDTRVVSTTIPQLEKGVTNVIAIKAKILNDAPDEFTNSGSLKYIDMVTNEENSRNSNSVKNTLKPDPYITKEVDKKEALVDDILTYTIKVGNKENAGAWRNVAIDDDLNDKGYTYIANTLTVDGKHVGDSYIEDSVLNYTVGDILENEEHVITFKVKVVEIKDYINKVVANSTNNPPIEDSVKTTNKNVEGHLELAKSIIDESGTSVAGKQLNTNKQYTYRLTITNPVQNAIEDDIVIEDVLNKNLHYVKDSIKGSSGVEAKVEDGKIMAKLNRLYGVAVATVEFKVTVDRVMELKFDNDASYTAKDLVTNKKLEGVSNKVVNTLKPDPYITKVVDKNKALLNDVLTYTIKVGNKANAGRWDNVVLIDDLEKDANSVKYIEGSLKVDGKEAEASVVNNKISVKLGTILENEEHTITYKVRIIDVLDGVYKNFAHATGDEGETPDVEAQTEVDYHESKVDITKAVLKDGEDINEKQVYTNNEYTYKLVVNNSVEYSKYFDGRIEDQLPTHTHLVENSVKVDNEEAKYVYEDGKLTVNIGDMLKGSKVVTFNVMVEDSANDKIINEASVIGKTTKDAEESTVVSNAVSNFVQPELSIIKEASVEDARKGETFTYSIIVANKENSGKADSVDITDELPEGLLYVPNTTVVNDIAIEDGTYWENNKFNFKFLDLYEGDKVKIDFTVLVSGIPDSKEVINNATAVGNYGENQTPPVDDSVKTPVEYQPGDATISKDVYSNFKKVNNEEVKVGDTLNYRIVVNSILENSKLTENVLTDTLPEGVDVLEDTIRLDDKEVKYTIEDGKLIIPLEDMMGLEEHVLTYNVVVLKDVLGNIVNEANITGKSIDETFSYDSIVSNPVESKVSLLKEVNKETVHAKEEFTYKLTVSNGEYSKQLQDIEVSDKLPKGLKLVKNSVKLDGNKVKYGLTDGVLKVKVAKLMASEKATITFNVQANKIEKNTIYKNTFSANINNEEVKSNEVLTKGLIRKTIPKTGNTLVGYTLAIVALLIAISATILYKRKSKV